MAKYTETFAEYVEGGGVLPSSSFALITGFEDLFKERFCGCEIGFETEALFAIKLDLKAQLVMPVYADRIAIVAAQMLGVKQSPAKVRYEVRAYGQRHSENSTDGTNTDLPYNATTATPSSTSHMDGDATNDAYTDNMTFTDELSIDERLRLIDALNKKAFVLVSQCLEEFSTLFMGIY